MMILAPSIGSLDPSISEGTCASQPSSSADSLEPLPVYHEPAWLATRVVIVHAGLVGMIREDWVAQFSINRMT